MQDSSDPTVPQAPGTSPEDVNQDFHARAQKMRATYSKNGIPSKEVGFQLANQAFSEGRLNESQLVTAHKALGMLYDPQGHKDVKKFGVGKDKGLDLVRTRSGK